MKEVRLTIIIIVHTNISILNPQKVQPRHQIIMLGYRPSMVIKVIYMM